VTTESIVRRSSTTRQRRVGDTETAQRSCNGCLFDDDITLDQMQSDAKRVSVPRECRIRRREFGAFSGKRTWMIFYGARRPKRPQWINEGSD